MTSKENTSRICGRAIRLRDAVEYCKKMRIDTSEFSSIEDLPVKCCTCDRVRTFRQVEAGHCFPRGMGGGSGAYLEEENINAQCTRCNVTEGGRQEAHKLYIRKKYGQAVLDKLERLHRNGKKYVDLKAIRLKYKKLFEQKVREI